MVGKPSMLKRVMFWIGPYLMYVYCGIYREGKVGYLEDVEEPESKVGL